MYATPKHLFIGMPKCGCVYVVRVLKAAFPGCGYPGDGTHTPLFGVPDSAKQGRKVVGIVRNPWEWYVSRWNYNYSRPGKEMPFGDWLSIHVADHRGTGAKFGLASSRLPAVAETIGLFTYMFMAYHMQDAPAILRTAKLPGDLHHHYSRWISVDVFMQTESLTNDLRWVFGSTVDPHLEQFRNSIPHRPYQEYYTPEWRDRIGQLDGALAAKHSYSFD